MAEDTSNRSSASAGPGAAGAGRRRPAESSAGAPADASSAAGQVAADASDAPPAPTTFLRSLADKWQLPLLAFGVLLLLAGLPRLLYRKTPINVDDQIAQARQALRDNQQAEAIGRIDRLLNAKMDDSQRSQIVLIRGLANYALAGMQPGSQDATQRAYARQAIADFNKAVEFAGAVDALDARLTGPAEFFLRRGQARMWSLDTGEADVLEALARVSAGQEPLRRQAVELLWNVNSSVVRQQLDGMLARADLAPADRLWAIRKKSQLLVREDRLAEAEQMLDGYLEKLPAGATQDTLEIQLARVHYEACVQPGGKLTPAQCGRMLDQAYLMLSAVQLRRVPVASEEEVDAELHWLLGEVNFLQDRPEDAGRAFERVVREYPTTPFGRAARLGVAKSAAMCRPIDEAKDAYTLVVTSLLREPDDPLIDRRAVQSSLLALAEQLRLAERWEPAYEFLTLLYPMVDAAQVKPSQADLKEKQGQLLRRVAMDEKQAADRLIREAALAGQAASAGSSGPGRLAASPASQPEDVGHLNADARRHLQMAAEAFLDAARLATTDDERSGVNLELAANCYDEAGETIQAIVVLKKFIQDYSSDQTRAARAAFNLGKAYQGAGQYEQAITQYQRMLSEYRNSPDANKSQVPMAQCYKAMGKPDEAENVLAGLLADDQRYSPDSSEYQSALFELAKLKYERRQYRQAIARFDEVLQRAPDSPAVLYCHYYLADSYRLSGIELDATIASVKTPLERQQLTAARAQWLQQAREQFDRVVAAFESRSGDNGEPSELDGLYLRNSYFFRADCAFDLGLYAEAIDLYDVAALKFHGLPEAVAAAVQIVNCYQRMGQPEQARTANERAKWLLKKLPPENFTRRPLPLGKDYFAGWLDWAGQAGTW